MSMPGGILDSTSTSTERRNTATDTAVILAGKNQTLSQPGSFNITGKGAQLNESGSINIGKKGSLSIVNQGIDAATFRTALEASNASTANQLAQQQGTLAALLSQNSQAGISSNDSLSQLATLLAQQNSSPATSTAATTANQPGAAAQPATTTTPAQWWNGLSADAQKKWKIGALIFVLVFIGLKILSIRSRAR